MSLSAGLDVITCNKEDLLFKTTCLEDGLLRDASRKSSDDSSSAHQPQAKSEKLSVHYRPKSAQSEENFVLARNISRTPHRQNEEAIRDAVVTKTTFTSSSLASPRFVSTVTNKLPSFIAHRSCQCFECRNSMFHELLVSLGLLQGLYYQLNKEYELTKFCFESE